MTSLLYTCSYGSMFTERFSFNLPCYQNIVLQFQLTRLIFYWFSHNRNGFSKLYKLVFSSIIEPIGIGCLAELLKQAIGSRLLRKFDLFYYFRSFRIQTCIDMGRYRKYRSCVSTFVYPFLILAIVAYDGYKSKICWFGEFSRQLLGIDSQLACDCCWLIVNSLATWFVRSVDFVI